MDWEDKAPCPRGLRNGLDYSWLTVSIVVATRFPAEGLIVEEPVPTAVASPPPARYNTEMSWRKIGSAIRMQK